MRSHNNGTTHIVMDIWAADREWKRRKQFKRAVKKLARDFTTRNTISTVVR